MHPLDIFSHSTTNIYRKVVWTKSVFLFDFRFSLFVFRFPTFQLSSNIQFWMSTCYFDIRTESEIQLGFACECSYFDIWPMAGYRKTHVQMLSWHLSCRGRIIGFDIYVAFSFLSDKSSDLERLSAFIFLVAIRSLENADNNLFVGRCWSYKIKTNKQVLFTISEYIL